MDKPRPFDEGSLPFGNPEGEIYRVSAAVTALALLVLSPHTISAESVPRFTNEEATIMMAASYMGAAHYCIAYGVDYRKLSDEVHAGLNANHSDSGPTYLWNAAFASGQRGLLFSIAIHDFLDISLAESPRRVCYQAHRQAVVIHQMK